MKTQAYFEDIQFHIIETIKKAERQIHIAVAWFTDHSIFNELLKKAEDGVGIVIFLVDDDINKSDWGLDFSLLTDQKAEIYWTSKNLMHHKFCIIDESIVITGSYNWTKKASAENRENIVILQDDDDFIKNYSAEFAKLYDHYTPKDKFKYNPNPIGNSETIDFIKQEIRFLEREIANLEVEMDDALREISHFNRSLQSYLGVKLSELKEWELKIAEKKALKTQKPEDVRDFQIKQQLYQDFKDNTENDYSSSKKNNGNDTNLSLKIKKLFYNIAKMCHPDIVPPSQTDAAEKIFRLAKEASDKQDYEALEKIYNQLEQGIALGWDLDQIDEKDKLVRIRESLKEKLETISLQLATQQQSEEWRVIQRYADWNDYFIILKEDIILKIYNLEKMYNK